MSDAQKAIKEAFRQVYLILENIDSLLVDAHESLVEHGFVALHSGFQCDISKQDAIQMMPYHVSSFYEMEQAEGAGPQDTLGIAALLTDNDKEPVEPLLVGAVFRPRDPSTKFVAWWAHSAVMFPGLESLPLPALPPLPVEVSRKRGSAKSKANYWYDQVWCFTLPLTEINTPEDLESRFIKPLLDLYESVNGVR